MTWPGGVKAVYTIEHVLALELDDVNVQEELEKLPPVPPSSHVTVPVGVVGDFEVSVIFA